MARPGITYDQVAAEADAIIGEGQQPTINAVRDRIGTGSPNTVHRHLTVWRAARPQATATAPELPASLTSAIATEIERTAASARAEIESKLVQAQTEAVELSSVGEALEAERDELIEQVAVLTTERDTLAGKAEQQAADIKAQAERIEREQQAAEAARVDLAKVQLKIESSAERLVEQASEIERLRATLETERQARIVAEQQAAVLLAKLESMTERATKAETRAEQFEKQSQQNAQELNSARNQMQAQQVALDAATREIDDVRRQIKTKKATNITED
ncbi:MAG: DNA-binding protein [Methylobacter sp.]|nr:DNA-binding protein [Methylobacter sp.]